MPAQIPVLRNQLAKFDERMADSERKHRTVIAATGALRQEADLLAARQTERFRTDALVSAGGAPPPPKVVRYGA